MEVENDKHADGDAAEGELNFKKRSSGELLALEDSERGVDSTFTPSKLWKLKSQSCLQ
jgi:hypothetical protein